MHHAAKAASSAVNTTYAPRRYIVQQEMYQATPAGLSIPWRPCCEFARSERCMPASSQKSPAASMARRMFRLTKASERLKRVQNCCALASYRSDWRLEVYDLARQRLT